jgi:DNA repair photolyase
VLRTETDNALVLKAASELFDRFGLPKLTRQEATVDASTTINETDESLISKFRSATPEMQEKAAQLHELFEEGLKNILAEEENGKGEQ